MRCPHCGEILRPEEDIGEHKYGTLGRKQIFYCKKCEKIIAITPAI
jgi:predicted RNA-binding Zn-ribbon protein involved in translation (DUF1610 family)